MRNTDIETISPLLGNNRLQKPLLYEYFHQMYKSFSFKVQNFTIKSVKLIIELQIKPLLRLRKRFIV